MAISGLLDVSKDGRLGVDGMLQVFDVHSGLIVVSFSAHRWPSHHTGRLTDDCVKLVRLTADGKYALICICPSCMYFSRSVCPSVCLLYVSKPLSTGIPNRGVKAKVKVKQSTCIALV